MASPADSSRSAPSQGDSPGSPIETIEPIEPEPFAGPLDRGGYPVWSARHGQGTAAVQVRFVGRRRTDGGSGRSPDAEGATPADSGASASTMLERARVLRATEGRDLPLAGLRQVHSDRVLAAPGDLADLTDPVGEADALVTETPGLALSVVTADCVPVILAGWSHVEPGRASGWTVAAVHAGWRGIVAGVVPRTLETLAARGVRPTAVAAWIGPAIGACCYEVSEEVAVRVASVSGAECIVPASGALAGSERPRLDLVAAVRHQLTAAGVPAPRVVLRCTRCDGEHLWSYRREGAAAGRNVAFVWVEPDQLDEPNGPDRIASGEPPCD